MNDLSPPPSRRFGPLSRTDIVRYQGASGDMFAVHHDEGQAKAAGFPGVFSVGMLQAGLLATWACDWLGPENIRAFRTRFTDQVWPGDELTCGGKTVRVYEKEGTRYADVELECTRQTGSVAARAWATFVLMGAGN